MRKCEECRRTMPDSTRICPGCGHQNVSVPDDRLDALVTAASRPNLASLFRKAKDSGAIKAFEGYPGGPPA